VPASFRPSLSFISGSREEISVQFSNESLRYSLCQEFDFVPICNEHNPYSTLILRCITVHIVITKFRCEKVRDKSFFFR
jgi:hypothetical protein